MTGSPLDFVPLIQNVVSGAHLLTTESIGGEHYNEAWLLTVALPDSNTTQWVVKRFREYGGSLERKAQVEYLALQMLAAQKVPAPSPLLMDTDGALLGAPCLVTQFVEGELRTVLADPVDDPARMARTLAQIHRTPCNAQTRAFLLDADAECLWFTRTGEIPDYLAAYPLGPRLWDAMQKNGPLRQPVAAGLVHTDYWLGNLLWRDSEIACVLDWEEAAWGDPAVDVAYCAMDHWLDRGQEMAAAFLTAYQNETGPLPNLAFWSLAAAVRPIQQPDWLADVRVPLDSFILQALAEIEPG